MVDVLSAWYKYNSSVCESEKHLIRLQTYLFVKKCRPSKKYTKGTGNFLQFSGSGKNILILLTSASCLYVFIGQHFAGKSTWCADRIGSWSFMVCIFGVDSANLALQEDNLSRAKSCFGCAKVRQELIATLLYLDGWNIQCPSESPRRQRHEWIILFVERGKISVLHMRHAL